MLTIKSVPFNTKSEEIDVSAEVGKSVLAATTQPLATMTVLTEDVMQSLALVEDLAQTVI